MRKIKDRSMMKSWSDHVRDRSANDLEKENAYLRQRIGKLLNALDNAKARLDMCARTEANADQAFALFKKAINLSNEAVIARRIVMNAAAEERDINVGIAQSEGTKPLYIPYREYA